MNHLAFGVIAESRANFRLGETARTCLTVRGGIAGGLEDHEHNLDAAAENWHVGGMQRSQGPQTSFALLGRTCRIWYAASVKIHAAESVEDFRWFCKRCES